MASVIISLANKLARRLSDTQVPSSVRFDVDVSQQNTCVLSNSLFITFSLFHVNQLCYDIVIIILTKLLLFSIALVAAESFDPEKDSDDNNEEERQIYPKSDSQRARLTNAVKEILLFRCLDDEQKSKVIDAMQEMKVKQGDVVITQGDDGDNFYVIESGTYDIYVRQNQSSNEKLGEKVGSYNGQGSFGELALMYNTSRAASIVAATDGILWLMDRNTFRRIVLKAAFHKRQAYIELLEDIPLLKELSSYERTNVADALQSRVYQDGATIITQGETGKEMFIIESGTVRISVKENSEEVELSRVGKGAYFGELALITKRPRAASAYAVGQTKVAVPIR
ncbi:cAMP-dependent protein kinase type II regulatory subunit [Schistosoma japonicum]|nr:cAMP-dependent protein kinase type II regulatory subunit [Schistosoma japonicum]